MRFEIELTSGQVKELGLKTLEDKLKRFESSNIEENLDGFTLWVERMLHGYRAELDLLDKELSLSRLVTESNVIAFETVKENLKFYDLYRISEEE